MLIEIQFEKNNIKSSNFTNWSLIQNTTRPRPEGGEDEQTKPPVDGLSNIDTTKVIQYFLVLLELKKK